MAKPCAKEIKRVDKAFQKLNESYDAFESAQEKYEEETSVLDESSWYDVGGYTTLVGGCIGATFITGGAALVVCGLSILGGGAATVGSEIDRWKDINAAKEALEAARRSFWSAKEEFDDALNEQTHCLLHNARNG
jgi:hypothetical protein